MRPALACAALLLIAPACGGSVEPMTTSPEAPELRAGAELPSADAAASPALVEAHAYDAPRDAGLSCCDNPDAFAICTEACVVRPDGG